MPTACLQASWLLWSSPRMGVDQFVHLFICLPRLYIFIEGLPCARPSLDREQSLPVGPQQGFMDCGCSTGAMDSQGQWLGTGCPSPCSPWVRIIASWGRSCPCAHWLPAIEIFKGRALRIYMRRRQVSLGTVAMSAPPAVMLMVRKGGGSAGHPTRRSLALRP